MKRLQKPKIFACHKIEIEWLEPTIVFVLILLECRVFDKLNWNDIAEILSKLIRKVQHAWNINEITRMNLRLIFIWSMSVISMIDISSTSVCCSRSFFSFLKYCSKINEIWNETNKSSYNWFYFSLLLCFITHYSKTYQINSQFL